MRSLPTCRPRDGDGFPRTARRPRAPGCVFEGRARLLQRSAPPLLPVEASLQAIPCRAAHSRKTSRDDLPGFRRTAKVLMLFAQREMVQEPTIAQVDEEICSGCGFVCPPAHEARTMHRGGPWATVSRHCPGLRRLGSPPARTSDARTELHDATGAGDGGGTAIAAPTILPALQTKPRGQDIGVAILPEVLAGGPRLRNGPAARATTQAGAVGPEGPGLSAARSGCAWLRDVRDALPQWDRACT